ncbi:MAG: hypothetical protein FJ110_03865 [Deltaproteobacteria bacterium]|nr:hypothetical protein [Deltaproteobacteria bacterium]
MLAVLGVIYSILISSQRTLTGIYDLDGIIGVVFGLFICSRPAANLVDLLFYRQSVQNQFPSSRAIVLWVTLNTLILLIGGIAIFFGTTRFIGKAS